MDSLEFGSFKKGFMELLDKADPLKSNSWEQTILNL